MPNSLRAKLSKLRYKGLLEDKDYQRLCKALDLEKAIEDIKAEIEKAIDDFYYTEHDLGVRQGFRFALEIIDKHIGKENE